MEVKTRLETVREVAEERGSGPDGLSKVLLLGGLGIANLWVVNLDVDGSDAAKNRGSKREFHALDDRY